MVILKKLLRRDSKKPICIDQKDKMCHPGHQTAASCPIPVSYVWNAATKRAGIPPLLGGKLPSKVGRGDQRWLVSDIEAECHIHKTGKC